MKKFTLLLVVISVIVGSGLTMAGCATTQCGCDEPELDNIKTGQQIPVGGTEAGKVPGWSS